MEGPSGHSIEKNDSALLWLCWVSAVVHRLLWLWLWLSCGPRELSSPTTAPALEDGFFIPEPAGKSQRGLSVTLCSCIPNLSESYRLSLLSESHRRDPILAYFIKPRDFWDPSEKHTSTKKWSHLLQETRQCLQPDRGPRPDLPQWQS